MPRTKAPSCSQHLRSGVQITRIAVLCELMFSAFLALLLNATALVPLCPRDQQPIINGYLSSTGVARPEDCGMFFHLRLENCSHRASSSSLSSPPFLCSASSLRISPLPQSQLISTKCGQTIAYQVLEHRDRPERTRCVNLRRYQPLLIPRTTCSRQIRESIAMSVKMHK